MSTVSLDVQSILQRARAAKANSGRSASAATPDVAGILARAKAARSNAHAYEPSESDAAAADDFAAFARTLTPVIEPQEKAEPIEDTKLEALKREQMETPDLPDAGRLIKRMGAAAVNRASQSIRSIGAGMAAGMQAEMGQPSVDVRTPQEMYQNLRQQADKPVVQTGPPEGFWDKVADTAGTLIPDIAEYMGWNAIIPGAGLAKRLSEGGKLAKGASGAVRVARSAGTFAGQSSLHSEDPAEIAHGAGMGGMFGAIELIPGKSVPVRLGKTILESVAMERATAMAGGSDEDRAVAFLTPWGIKAGKKAAQAFAAHLRSPEPMPTNRKAFDEMGIDRTSGEQREGIATAVEAARRVQSDPKSQMRDELFGAIRKMREQEAQRGQEQVSPVQAGVPEVRPDQRPAGRSSEQGDVRPAEGGTEAAASSEGRGADFFATAEALSKRLGRNPTRDEVLAAMEGPAEPAPPAPAKKHLGAKAPAADPKEAAPADQPAAGKKRLGGKAKSAQAEFSAYVDKMGLKPPPSELRGRYARWKALVDADPVYQRLKAAADAENRSAGKRDTQAHRAEQQERVAQGDVDRENIQYAPLHELPDPVRSSIQEEAQRLIGMTKSERTRKALEKIVQDAGSDKGAEVENQKARIVANLTGESAPNAYERWVVDQQGPPDPLVEAFVSADRAQRIRESITSIDRGEPDALAQRAMERFQDNPLAEPAADARAMLEDLLGQPVEPPAVPVSAPTTDLFGNRTFEAATGAQRNMEFGRDLQGEQPTQQGWLTTEGKLRPDMNKAAEQQMGRQMAEEGQLSFAEQAARAADAELSGGPGIVAKPKGLRLRSDKIPVPEAVAAPNPEVEANLAKARGVVAKTLFEGIKERVVRQYRRATRAQEFLPNNEQFGPANELMRLYKDILQQVADEAARLTATIINPLGEKQLILFERKVVMDNLAAAIERGEPLRFGFKSADEVAAYLKQLDDLIAKTPEVQQALETRRKVVRELVEQLVKHKILPEAALERADTYYHQQVLAYYEEGRSPARQSKGLHPRKASFQKKRIEGIESLEPLYDYNTSYIEAESKWMTEALAQVRTQETLQQFERIYDKMPQFKERAKQQNWETAVGGAANAARIVELRGELKSISQELNDLRNTFQPNARGARVPRNTAQRNSVKAIKARGQSAIKELMGLDPTYEARKKIARGLKVFGKASFAALNEAARKAPDSESGIAARMVLKGIAERDAIIKQRAGDRFMTWERLLAKDPAHDAWQPVEGNVFFKAFTVPEQLVEQARKALMGTADIPVEAIKQALAMGGPKKTYIFPKELVEQLDSMTKQGVDTSLSRELMNTWKAYTLMNPKRALPYMLRNVAGDLDPVIAGAAPALKKIPATISELRKYHDGQHLSMSPAMRAARDHAVISSSMTAQEVPQLKDLEIFKRFYESMDGKQGMAERVARLPAKYFEVVRNFNEFRENSLRYAVFLHYREMLNTKQPINHYGASRPEIVKAIQRTLGNDAAAAHLARNLLGDYGNLTVTGNYIRDHLLPFYSWMEVNASRYPRIAMNAVEYGKLKGADNAAARAAYTALALAGVGGLTALLYAYNNTVWPEEEAGLSADDRNSGHIILGRNPDGTVRVFRNVGALTDLLEWGGINTLVSLLPQYQNGQLTGADLAREMAKSPANKLIQGLRPDLKAGYEAVTGTSLFPDAFSPRSQPRDEAITNAFGLTDEYREIKGRLMDTGERARPNYRQRLLVGVVDPRLNALHEVYDLRDKYLRQQGKDSGGTFAQSPAKPMRDAASAGDYEAFAEARDAYLRSGKSYANFIKTLDGLDPLSQRLSDADEQKFSREFLTGEQRAKLTVAREYAQVLKETMAVWWERAEKASPSDHKVRAEIAGNRLMQLTDPEPKRKLGESTVKFRERKDKWKAEKEKAQAELGAMGLSGSQKRSLLKQEYRSRGGKGDSDAFQERMRRVR